MASNSYINDSRHGSRGTSPSPYKRSASIASTSYGGGGSGVGDGQTHTSRTRALARELAKETTPATLRDLEPLRHDIEKIKADLRNLERKNKFVSPDVVDTTWRELLNVKAFIGYSTGPGGRTPPGGRTWSSYHQHFLEDDEDSTNNGGEKKRLLIEGARHERIRREGEGDEDNTEKERTQSQRMKQKGDASEKKGGTRDDKAFNIESSVAGSDSDGGGEGTATPPRGLFGDRSRKQTKAAKPHTLASLAASGAPEEIVVNADGTNSSRASQSPSNLGGHARNNTTSTTLTDVEALSPLTADDLFYGGSSSLTAVATTPAGQPKTPSSSAAAAGGGSGAQAVTPNSAHLTSLGFGASFGPEALRKVIAYEVAEAMKAYDLKCKQEREPQQGEKGKRSGISIGNSKSEAVKDRGDSEEDERDHHHNHDTFRRGGCYNTDFIGSHCCERNAEVHLEANRRLRIYLDESNRRAQLVQSFTSHWLISLSREHGRLIEVYDAHLSSLHRTSMNDVEVFLRHKDPQMRQGGVPLPSRGGADDTGNNITSIVISGGEEGLNSYHHRHGNGNNSEHVAIKTTINNKNKNTSHFFDHVVGGRAVASAATSLANPQHVMNHHHLQEQHFQQQERQGGGGDFLYSPPFAPEQSYHNQLLRRDHLARAAEDESEAEDDENVNRVLKRKLGGAHGHGVGVGGRQHYHHLDPFASPPALNSHVTGTAYSNLVSDRFRAKAEALVTIIREDPYLVEKIGSAVLENKCVERAMRNDLVLAKRELPASVSSSALLRDPSNSAPSYQGATGVATADLVSSAASGLLVIQRNDNNSNALGNSSGVQSQSTASSPSWLSIIDEVTAAQSEAAIERAVEHFNAIVEDKIVPRLNTLAHSKIKEVNENTKVALRAAEKFIEKRQVDSAAAVENTLNTVFEERSATLKKTAEEEAKSVVNVVLVDRIRECEGLMKQLTIERDNIKSCMDDARREDTRARDAASRRLWEALVDGMTVTTSRQIQHQEKENRSKGNGVAVGAAEAQAHSLLSRLLLPLPGSSSGIRASPSELVLPSSATQQHSTRHGGNTKKHNETSVLLTEQGLLETVARIGGAITKMSLSPCYSSSSLMDAIAFSVVSDEEAASFIKAVRAMRIDVEADYDDDDSDDVKQSESERKRSSQAPRPSVRVLAVLQPAASLLSELTRLIQNYNKRLGEEAEDEEGSINSLMTLEKLTALLNPSSSSDYVIPQGAAKKKEDNVSSDDGERTGDDEEYSSDRGYTAGAPMKKRRKRNENWQNRSLTTLLESARKAIFSVTTHQRTTSSQLTLPSWQTLASLALSIAASEYSKSQRIEADRLTILRSAAVKEQLKSNKSSSKRLNQAEEGGTSSSDASDDEMVISTRHTNRRNNHENNNDDNNKYVKAHRERFGHPIITALRVHWHFILCTYAATTVQHSSFATLSQCARDVVVVYGIDDDKRTSTAERSESSDRPLRSHSVKSANSRRNQSDHQLSLPPQHPLNNGSTSSNNTSRNVSVTTRNTATSITTKAKTPSTTSLSQRVAVEDNDDDDKEEDVISTTQLNSNSSTRIHYHQSTHSATALMLRNQHLSRVPAMDERRQRSLTEESEKRTKGGRGGLDGKRSPSFPLAAARANSLHPDEGGSRGGAPLHPHSSVLLDHHHPYGVGVSRESEQQRETERSSSSSKSGGRDFSKAKNATTASSPLVLPPYSSSSYPSPSSPYSPNVDDPTKPLAIAISQLADALNAGNERARSQQQHQNYHDGDNQLPPSALSQALESNINSRKQEELQLRKMLAEAELRYRNVQKGQLQQYQQQQPPPQEQQYNNNIPEAQPSFSSSPAAHTADAFQRQNQQPPFQSFHRQELATPATVGVGSEGGGGTRAAAALFRGASTGTTHHYGTMGLGASPDVRGAMLMGGGGGGPSYSPYPHQPVTTTFTPRVVDVGYSTTNPHLQHRQQGGGGSSAHVMAAMEVTAAAGDGNGGRDVVGVLGLGKSAVQEADALVSKVEATAVARRMKRESYDSNNDRHAVVVPSREVPSRQMSYMYEESEEKETRRTTDGKREGIHVNTQQPQPQLNTETRTNTTGATTATSAEGMTGISSSSSSKKKKITVYHHHHSYISSAASSVASSISMEDNNNDNGFHVTDVTGGGVTKIRTLSGGMAPPPPSPPTELVTAAGVLSGVPNGVGVSTKRNSKLAIGATGSAAALAPIVATTGGVGGGSGVGSNNGGGGGFYTAASTATIAGRSTSIQQKKLSTRVAAASSQHTNSGGGQQLPAHQQQQQQQQQQHGQFYRSSSSSAAAAAPSQQQRRA